MRNRSRTIYPGSQDDIRIVPKHGGPRRQDIFNLFRRNPCSDLVEEKIAKKGTQTCCRYLLGEILIPFGTGIVVAIGIISVQILSVMAFCPKKYPCPVGIAVWAGTCGLFVGRMVYCNEPGLFYKTCFKRQENRVSFQPGRNPCLH